MERFYKIMFSNDYTNYIEYDKINFKNYMFNYLSKNSVMQIETIKQKSYLICHRNWILENPNIGWEYIKLNLHSYDKYVLSKQKYITSDIILKYSFVFIPSGLSCNPNISSSIFNKFEYNWDLDRICKNANLDWVNELKKDHNWNYWFLSLNRNISWDVVSANLDKPWSFKNLSRNVNITPTIVEKNISLDWCWINLSRNPNINIDFIKKFSSKNWCWKWVTRHQNIKFEDIIENSSLPWNYNAISSNKNITPQIVNDYLNGDYNSKIDTNIIHWNIVELASNHNFSLGDITKLTNIFYQPKEIWDNLSSNRNIDWIDISQFNQKYNLRSESSNLMIPNWNYIILSQNDMFYARRRRIKKKLTYYFNLIFRQIYMLEEIKKYIVMFI